LCEGLRQLGPEERLCAQGAHSNAGAAKGPLARGAWAFSAGKLAFDLTSALGKP